MVTLSALLVSSVLAAPGETVLLEFSSPGCHYCRVMQTTVDRLQEKGYPVRVVNVEREQQLAQRFHARFLPTFVLVHRGQEVARHEGATSFDRLAGMFEKIERDSDESDRGSTSNSTSNSTSGPSIRGQNPRSVIPSLKLSRLNSSANQPSPPSAEDRPHVIDRPSDSRDNGTGESSGALGTSSGPSEDNERSTYNVDNRSASAEQVAFQATVRLKVIDRGGHSFGTGTIVDSHDGYALVITCGHLFREVGKAGQVEVDLFNGSGHPRTVRGRVITFDADQRDIALVEIQPGVEVQPAPVASDVSVVRRSANVFTIGCNQGDDPTIVRSRISAIDKYIGFPNIEVSGQPVVGRSGGGLFTADGFLIGICNAADEQDNEGIYAGLPMILEELASVGIDPKNAQPKTILVDRDIRQDRDRDRLAARDHVHRNEPAVNEPAVNELIGSVANQSLPAGVSQLICVVRTQENPQGELVVIDNPTPELLAKLRRPADSRGPADLRREVEPRVADAGDSWRPVRKPIVE